MGFELLKMGKEVLIVSSKKKKSGICMNGLKKHVQNLRQFTRWDSNPPEYEALIYTNIQLICSMTFNVTHATAIETSAIFTHVMSLIS
jgi:hypothetical protein